MKAIPLSIADTITASSSVTNFPPEYALTPHPSQKWKGGTPSSTLQLPLSDLFDTVSFFGVEATSVDVEIVADSDSSVLYSGSFDMTGIYNLADFMLGKGFPVKRIWIDTGFISQSCVLSVTFNVAENDTPACGLVWPGMKITLPNFANGFTEGRRYPGIIKQIQTGSPWVRWLKRVNRTFTGSLIAQRSIIRRLMGELDNDVGLNPIPWLIANDIAEEFAVYAMFMSTPPQQAHGQSDFTSLTINLLEIE